MSSLELELLEMDTERGIDMGIDMAEEMPERLGVVDVVS